MNPFFNRRSFLFSAVACTQLGMVAAQPVAGNPNHALKLIIVGRRKPGMTLADHRQHIRKVHGEIVMRYIAAQPAIAPQRYAQHQVIDGQYRATTPGTDNLALNRDFVTQIWFKDPPAMVRSVQTDFYRDHLKGDEDNFVDQKTVVFCGTNERVISSRKAGLPTATLPGTKLFFFIQRTPEADPQAFKAAWAALGAGTKPWPLAARIERHVQNDVLPSPQGVPPYDGIDEFWVDDEASARELLKQWQAAVRDKLVRTGLATESGHFGLLATEDLIYPGTT